MAYNIGLNVIEVDGLGAPAIQGAATSVAGFNILTRRGAPNRPTRVTSFAQFTERFGSYFPAGLGAYLVKGFFDNGGQTAYINRIVGTDATTGALAAGSTLKDGASADLVRLSGGFRGVADPGSWANDIFLKVTATNTPSTVIREVEAAKVDTVGLGATVNMSAAPPLEVAIDGEAAATTIAFQASDFANAAAATPAEIRDAILSRTTKLRASVEGGQIRLVSMGQRTSLKVTSHPALPFPTTLQNGTLAALTATSTVVSNPDVVDPGDAIVIQSGPKRALGKVTQVSANGSVQWASADATINTFVKDTLTIRRLEFDLSVARGSGLDDNLAERFTGLSLERDHSRYVLNVINDANRGSKLLRATEVRPASDVAVHEAAALAYTQLSPGRDGTPTAAEFVGSPENHTGFYAFDPADIQLLTCERSDFAVVKSALGYCEQRGDCTYVGSVPEGIVGAGTVGDYTNNLKGKKVYGALYGPHIKILDPLSGGFKFVPAAGHVMGVYARIETARGIFKAPAGDEAFINGALDVEFQLSDTDHTNMVKGACVNGIRAVAGAGIVIDASRTLSTDTRWLYVNVRLLFNYVKSSLKQGLRWVRQEPNRDTLWSLVRNNSVIPFLMGLYRRGAFGTGKPEEVFTVICDASNNPPDQVDQGIFKLEVYFYPSRPAETIVILVGQQPSGASAAEA